MGKVRAVILAILVVAGMILVPAGGASAHDLAAGCHHKTPANYGWWEENFLREYNSGMYHFHVYSHFGIFTFWDKHVTTEVCGKLSNGTYYHWR